MADDEEDTVYPLEAILYVGANMWTTSFHHGTHHLISVKIGNRAVL